MSGKTSPNMRGEYVSVYLAQPIYLHIEREARREGIGIATWIRNTILNSCPEEIRISAGEFGRGRRPPAQPAALAANAAPQASRRPTEPPQPPSMTRQQRAEAKARDAKQAAFDGLVERSRKDVLALAAKGYRDNAIAAIAHLPYRVVQHITATEAATQKRRRKE